MKVSYLYLGKVLNYNLEKRLEFYLDFFFKLELRKLK